MFFFGKITERTVAELGKFVKGVKFIITIYHRGQFTKFYIIFPDFQRNIHVNFFYS